VHYPSNIRPVEEQVRWSKASLKIMEQNGLAWSLKPILICLKISGMPTHDISTNRCRFFAYIFSIITLISLLFNFSFNTFYFLKNWLFFYQCKWPKSPPKKRGIVNVQIDPARQILEFFETVINPSFLLGVPLIFVFEFYITGGWRTILSSIIRIDQDMMLTKRFYRRCRRRFILLIFISLLVRKTKFNKQLEFTFISN